MFKHPLLRVMAICLLATMAGAQHAKAQSAVVCVNCSTVVTQAIQYAEQLQEAATQLEQYSTQLQQYSNMLQNTATLPLQVYGSIVADENAVNNLLNVGTEYQLGEPLAPNSTLSFDSANLASLPSEEENYTNWSQQAHDNIAAAMNAAGEQESQLPEDQATITSLQTQNKATTGQLQAIQVVSEVAAQAVAEMEKMRQLQLIQIQSEQNKDALATEKQADSDARDEAFFGTSKPPMTTGQSFSAIPGGNN